MRSRAIDMLRGLAVGMVMCAHLPFSGQGVVRSSGTGSFPPAPFAELMAHGHYGVQLFLVISGYCIHMRWASSHDPQARIGFLPFWRRRLTRLYPPYIVVVLLSVAVTIVASRVFPGSVPPATSRQRVVDFILLVLLLQNMTDAGTRFGNPPLWSLALEEQLYLLYFPLLAVRRRYGWSRGLLLSLLVTVAWFGVGRFVPPSWQFGWYRAGPAYWFAWALGAVVAEADVGSIRLPEFVESIWTFLVVLAVAALSVAPFRDLFVTISFFFLVATMAAQERRGSRWLRWFSPLIALGTISYGVYLVHNIAFVVAKRLLVALGTPDWLTLVLRAGVGVVSGYLFFRLLESPFLALSQRVGVPVLSRARSDR